MFDLGHKEQEQGMPSVHHSSQMPVYQQCINLCFFKSRNWVVLSPFSQNSACFWFPVGSIHFWLIWKSEHILETCSSCALHHSTCSVTQMNADLALTATVSTRAGLECVLTELQNAQRWMCEGMQESTALIKIRQTHLCVLLFLWFEASHSEMWQQSWWSWQHFTTWVHNQKLREQQCCKKTDRQGHHCLPVAPVFHIMLR